MPYRDWADRGQLQNFFLHMNDTYYIGTSQLRMRRNDPRQYWIGSLADYLNRMIWESVVNNNTAWGQMRIEFGIYSNVPMDSLYFRTYERLFGSNVYTLTGQEYRGVLVSLIQGLAYLLNRFRDILDFFRADVL
jgi:hypothetical protein